MSEEDALLAAIAAHPDEDTPRLAYADWLDEHGRHVRAEFIRVQVEVARVETLPRVLVNRHVDVFRRQQELIDHHRDELLGPLAVLPGGAKVEFRRGFVSEVTLENNTLIDPLDEVIWGLRPTPRVVIEDSVFGVFAFLGRGEPLIPEIVTAIRTRENRGADDARLEALLGVEMPELDSEDWPKLEELDISGCRLGDRSFARLLRSAFPLLADLDVSVNDLTDAGVARFLGSALPRQLKRLVLGGNPLTDSAAIDLADRWPRGADDRLEHLNLRFTGIGQPGQQALLARFGGRIDLF